MLAKGAEAAVNLLEELAQQGPEPRRPAAAEFFDVPEEEYERWPRGRRLVLRAIYATRESFRKRTIALVRTLDTAGLGADGTRSIPGREADDLYYLGSHLAVRWASTDWQSRTL